MAFTDLTVADSGNTADVNDKLTTVAELTQNLDSTGNLPWANVTQEAQTANTVFAAPDATATVAKGLPTFRALVADDIPSLDAAKITTGQLALARGGTHADLSATGGAGQVLKQKTVGGNIAVEAIAAADLPATVVTTDTTQTITGAKTFGDGTAAATITINGAAGTVRRIIAETGGVLRWNFRMANATAEAGANAGSDCDLVAYADAGTLIGTALSFNRATMAATFGAGLTTAGNVLVGSTSGGLHVGGTSDPGDNNLIVDGTSLLSGDVSLTTKVAKYQNVTTAGVGTPPVLAVVALTGQTGAIGTTTAYAVPASSGGIYRVSFLIYITTTGNAVSLTGTLGWTNTVGTYSNSPVTIASCATPGFSNATSVIRCGDSSNITYETALGGAIGAGVYALDMVVERLT